ncbi:MAG: energy transducer TonB [Bacteroidales bacterium]|nr:energy transducer TonB [Bacteroidales bacterium]
MTTKKTNKTNLERKRLFFFEYGLLLILASLLVAFEWGNTKSDKDIYAGLIAGDDTEEMLIPITRTEAEKQVAPVKPEEFIIIDDSEPDITDIDIDWESEVGINEGIGLYIYEPEEEVADPDIFIRVEKMPSYRGGTEADFQKHLQQLVKYPMEAQEMGIQGKVTLKFVVNENGNITDPQIIQTANDLLSTAVMEALKKTDKWKPGEQRGRKVKVCFNVPVFFRLN